VVLYNLVFIISTKNIYIITPSIYNMEERQHILNILIKVQKALERKDYIEIGSLSNQVIHHSSIHQDPDIISIAVIIYALSKLIERDEFKNEKNWSKFYENYCKNIKNMIVALKKKDVDNFRSEVNSNRKLIKTLSGSLKFYINDVFRKAKINKASRIYEHGISMEQTAKILGITLWELAEYAGRTRIGDVNLGVTMPIRERVKLAEEIFK